jgi:BASS family bile acid:Na+ symporter
MNKTGILNLLKKREFILISALLLGIVFGDAARFTKQLTLPALALAMTVSVSRVSSSAFLPLQKTMRSTLLAVFFNYLVLSPVILLMGWWLMPESALWIGFVTVSAAPPGVGIIPFTYLLEGDINLSVIGTIGAYLAALIIAPLMTLLLLGEALLQPTKLVVIILELILVPLILSRVLLVKGIARYSEKWGGTVINWSFFLVIFTVVGLNREVFLGQPTVLVLSAVVASISTFGLGYLIELALKALAVDRPTRMSLILMGTVKNSGLAAAVALALFGERASVPGALVASVTVLFLICLGARPKRN